MQAANNAIAVLQQQIADMQALAAQQAAPPLPPPAAAAPVFALSPAGIRTNTFIDYSTSAGSKIFKSATDALVGNYGRNLRFTVNSVTITVILS